MKIDTIVSAHEKLQQYFYRIRPALDHHYMKVADILSVLDISIRQLFYWDSKGMSISKHQKNKRSWRRFSVFDLIGYAIVKELRNMGGNLEDFIFVIAWLKNNLCQEPEIFYNFTRANRIFLIINPVDKTVELFCISKNWTFNATILDLEKSGIIIPLHPILERIFTKIKKVNFEIKTTGDKSSGYVEYRTFIINEEPVLLELTEDELKVVEPDV